MIATRVRHALLLAATLVAAPGAVAAQQAASAAPAAPSAEVQGWLTELQQLHGRLEALQQKALSDPQISATQQSLGSSMKAAMEKLDPGLEKTLERVPQLEAQAAEASKSGDQARLQQLGMEMRQIERRFVDAQRKAMEQPELAARVLEFQERLQQRMRSVDPEAEKLFTRYQELESRLTAAMKAPGR